MTNLDLYKKVIDENGNIISNKPIKIADGLYVTLVSTSRRVFVRVDTNDIVNDAVIDIPKEYRSLEGAAKTSILTSFIVRGIAYRIRYTIKCLPHNYLNDFIPSFIPSHDEAHDEDAPEKVYDNEVVAEQDSEELLERVDWLYNLFANDEEKSSKKDKNKKEKEKKDKKKSNKTE